MPPIVAPAQAGAHVSPCEVSSEERDVGSRRRGNDGEGPERSVQRDQSKIGQPRAWASVRIFGEGLVA